VNEYRAYLIDRDGHIRQRVDMLCADDDAAKEQAKQLLHGRDVELWQLGRRVACGRNGAAVSRDEVR